MWRTGINRNILEGKFGVDSNSVGIILWPQWEQVLEREYKYGAYLDKMIKARKGESQKDGGKKRNWTNRKTIRVIWFF